MKVSDEDRAKIVQWVKDHPDVVASPIRRDTVWCKAPTLEDPKRKVKRNKLLHTISVREMHNGLFKPEIGLPEIVQKHGRSQLSDTVLREILKFEAPEIRKMSKFLKETCCCRICESMNFKQDALNMWRRKKRKELRVKWEELPEGTTRGQRDAKSAAAEELALFMAEGFSVDEDLHPTASAAALSIQCAPPAEFEGSGLTKLKCASSKCDLCPAFKRPAFELSVDDDSDTVTFLSFATKLTCSKHGIIPEGVECLTCKKMKNPKKRGKTSKKEHQMANQMAFQDFWAVYIEELQKFRMHLFQIKTNCKKFVTNVRRKAVKPGSIATQQDFAEALTIKHQKEVQAMHFGGNVTVSIEGYTVHFPNPVDEEKISFHFHSFLSDSKQQDSATVDNHMDKLIKCLKKSGVLQKGGRLLCSSDGCAKQCKCSSALRFMSHLSCKHEVAIDRAIGCPGHGKCEVDAINAVDKNTIFRESCKPVQNPEETSQVGTKLLQTFTVNNVRGGSKYSAAMNCKNVLESKGTEGVKSMGKSAKREQGRGIERRHWHVRGLLEQLSDVRCKTVGVEKFPEGCSFSDMHHYHVCPDLGPSRAALRRHPCNCMSCDEVISSPWKPGVKDLAKQPRFENPDGCCFRSLFDDENKWHFVELQERAASDAEEVDEERKVVLRHVTTSVARSIEIGNVGAYAFDKGEGDRGEEDCHLVEFASLPFTDQEGSKCVWKVKCFWLNSIPTARHWYTKSTDEATLSVVHLVATDLQMHPISPTNMVRSHLVRKDAERLGALRLSNHSHDFIQDEMERRERLECDPSRVFGEDEGSSGSEEEDEDEVDNF